MKASIDSRSLVEEFGDEAVAFRIAAVDHTVFSDPQPREPAKRGFKRFGIAFLAGLKVAQGPTDLPANVGMERFERRGYLVGKFHREIFFASV